MVAPKWQKRPPFMQPSSIKKMILVRWYLQDYLLAFSDGKKRVTFVPQTGQIPFTMRVPLAVVSTTPLLTLRLVRHLTQYPSNSMADLLRRKN
jgi:hypothetical protein